MRCFFVSWRRSNAPSFFNMTLNSVLGVSRISSTYRFYQANGFRKYAIKDEWLQCLMGSFFPRFFISLLYSFASQSLKS